MDRSTFFSKIDKNGPNGCWLWTGYIKPDGYGRVNVEGRRQYCHRFLYLCLKGEIPERFDIDHLCRVRHCVNPDHLEAVTHKENVNRGILAEVKRAEIMSHCPSGHEYTPENTYRSPNKSNDKRCRVCARERNRRVKREKSLAKKLLSKQT